MPLTAEIERTVRSVLESLQLKGLNPVMTAGEQARPQLDRDPAEALSLLPLGAKVLANIKIPPDLEDTEIRIKLPLAIPIKLPITLPIDLPIKLPLTLPGLGVNLDDIDLGATEAAADGTTLKMVLKAVEFDRPAETSADKVDVKSAALNELPYAVPTRVLATGLAYDIPANVQGLLGKVTGTIPGQGLSGTIAGTISPQGAGEISGKIEQTLVGSLEGTIGQVIDTIVTIPGLAGAITTPELLPLGTTFVRSVTWEVKGENGQDLTPDSYVLSDANILSPVLAFLPDFVELSGFDKSSPSRRQVSCRIHVDVKVKDSSGKESSLVTVDHTVGPFYVEIPKVPLPTVLAMLEHAIPSGDLANLGRWSPGGVLIAVPGSSTLRLDSIKPLLDPALAVLRNLRALKLLLPALPIPAFGDAVTFLELLLKLADLADPKPPAFERRDKVLDLWWVERKPGDFFLIGRKSFEDCITALILVGPPGRAVKCYRPKNLDERLTMEEQGMFELKVGPAAIAVVRTLAGRRPIDPIVCEPAGSRAIQHISTSDGMWNDHISSYQFMPL
ncbi:MAG: hypothetical protein ACLGI9_25065 [Thermoanaerobaculia bacterium]